MSADSAILGLHHHHPLGASASANHSDAAAPVIMNNVDARYCASSSSAGVSSARTAEIKGLLSASMIGDGQMPENFGLVKMKREKATYSSSSSSGTQLLTNHVDEKPKKKEKPLTKKELEEIKRHNIAIKVQVYKEIRRKGTSESLHFC